METKMSFVLFGVLIYLGILSIPKRKLFNRQHMIFTFMYVVSLLNMILDAFTIYSVNYLNGEKINDILHVCFLISINSFGFLLYLYTIANVTSKNLLTKKVLISNLLLFVLTTALMIFLPVEYVESSFSNYSSGAKVYALYASLGYYIIMLLYIIVKYWSSIESSKKYALTMSLVFVSLAAITQMIFPSVLLSAVAIAMIIVGLSYSNESYEKIIDKESGMFNLNAFKTMIDDYILVRKKFTIGVIDLNELFIRINIYTDLDYLELLKKIDNFFTKKFNIKVYRITESAIAIISQDYETCQSALNNLTQDIESKTRIRKIFTLIYKLEKEEDYKKDVLSEVISFAIESSNKDATYDMLTGVRNRNDFESKKLIYEGSDNNYFIIDLNYLKYTNDSNGHHAGDKYIKIVANCLKKVVGNDNDVYRIGGDEFALITKEEPSKIVERIEKLVAEENKYVDFEMQVAIGYCSFKDKDCYLVADKMMYECKLKQKSKRFIK